MPLALRALLRAPSRRLVFLLTRDPSRWVPSDLRHAHRMSLLELAEATTASAIQAAVTGGVPLLLDTTAVREFHRQQSVALVRYAGHLSPSLLEWCVRQDGEMMVLVRQMLANLLVTPRDLQRLRGFLEERAWRVIAAQRWDRVLHLVPPRSPAPSDPRLTDTVLAWLAARHPAEPSPYCPPFMTHVLATCVRAPIVLQAVFTLPHIPAALRQAIRDLVDREGTAVIRAVCQHVPRIMTPREIEAAVLRKRSSLRPWFLLEIFDVLPVSSRGVLWREAFATRPQQAVQRMAACPETRWPGLTADDLTPLLADASADIRLAAIQLLAGIPSGIPSGPPSGPLSGISASGPPSGPLSGIPAGPPV